MNLPSDPWDRHADWWQREFTEGADPEYVEQILPLIAGRLPTAGRLLDVGCGDGQVARMATAAGLQAIGVDPAGAQVRTATDRGGPSYSQASAIHLPVADASVDVAVACLVFEHIAEFRAALAEVARVLIPGGRFLFLLNHPLLQTPDSGWIDDHVLDPPEQYWRIGPYLTEAETAEQVEEGVWITFHHRPLSAYLNTAIEAGLTLERMDEPAPPPGFVARAPEYGQVTSIPRLLALQFRRR
ncbi:MAG: class I SAM-dependent methyltransferase [Microthrixaceae bacterium]